MSNIGVRAKIVKSARNRAASRFLACRRYRLNKPRPLTSVADSAQLLEIVERVMDNLSGRVGLLLSSGMDSAILAARLPPGSLAYTLDYADEQGSNPPTVSEFKAAQQYVPRNVRHKRIEVSKSEYFENIDVLTERMGRPTVPHEPALFKLITQAYKDGVEHVVTGLGADGHLGGLRAFYRFSTLKTFETYLFKRYVNPSHVLRSPYGIRELLEPYNSEQGFNVQRYLEEIGTEGDNLTEVIAAHGMNHVAPFATMRLAEPLDLNTPEKAILQEAFIRTYKSQPPHKRALWVPYDAWLQNVSLSHPDFRPGLKIRRFIPSEHSSIRGKMKEKLMSSAESLCARVQSQRLFSAKRGYLIYSLKRHFELNTSTK